MSKSLEHDYVFFGKHAKILKNLREEFDSDLNCSYFKYSYEILKIAPLIGFLFNKKAKRDKNTDIKSTIFTSEVKNVIEDLEYSLKIILLLDEDYISNKEDRIDKVFKRIDFLNDEEDLNLFDSYLLGGLEVLNECLIEPIKEEPVEYFEVLTSFIQDCADKSDRITNEEILEKCNKLLG